MNKNRVSRREWKYRGTAVLLGLLFGWVTLEILLRLAFPILPYSVQATLRHVHQHPFTNKTLLPPQIWQNDGNYQFISRNGVVNELQYPDSRISIHVTTKNWLDPDSHIGFRVPDVTWEPRWPVDAVLVGDSFTFCYTEYANCWAQRLSDQGLSIVNLGLVATGSRSHLNVLRTFGLPYEPRLVIWQWYGNDFNDDYGFALQRGDVDGDFLPSAIVWEPANPVLKWLHRNSAVYRFLDTIFASPARKQGVTDYIDPYQAAVGGETMLFGRPYTLSSTDLTNPKNQYGWKQSQTAFLEAREMLAAAHSQLIILLIPAKEEVYAALTTPVLGQAQLESLRAGREQMLTFCQQEGLTCLDATPGLMAYAEQDKLLYWSNDTHLNDLGNQYLAQIVYDFLSEQDLLVH